jgi:hypothetical protein
MPNSKRQSTTRSAYKTPSAMRYGVYSTTSVLPGENQAEFDKLHRDLIAEFHIEGTFERNIIARVARYLWRIQNLGTLQFSRHVQGRYADILNEMIAAAFPAQAPLVTHPDSKKMVESAKAQLRAEFGAACELAEIGDAASVGGLNQLLDLEERLCGMIDRSFNQLLKGRVAMSLPPQVSPNSSQPMSGPSNRKLIGVATIDGKEIDHAGS